MTDEEKQQVQNLINARTKLLTEKTARQDEEIKSLSATIISLSNTLESRENEIESLNEKLSQVQEELSRSQEQNRKLAALVQSDQTKPELPEITPKPSYLLSLLRQHFGFDNFKAGQEEIIDALLSGRDVFCSMPENYGKSICYRLPALLMPGVTLAVTPNEPDNSLITPHSEILTASLTPSKRREILRKVKNGTCKILYSTVQQLSEADTLSALKNSEISMTAVISRWGIPHSLENFPQLISSITPRKITAGIFADTTSPALRQELLKLADLHSPLKVVTGFRSDNASIRIIRSENKPSALNEILAQKKNMPGVIFCSTPETAYKLGEMLRDFDGLNDTLLIMPMLLYREIRRDDIRFTVHYDMPDTLGSLSQHMNVAVNAPKSEAIMLVSRNDIRNAERPLVSFCKSETPGDFLLSYLGADESVTPKIDAKADEPAKISPDDVSDFDFADANEAQREAITSTNGPMLIIAGPGTGKTFTLVQRTVFLIQKKRVNPENIMLATFTDKAANEIVTRVTQELSRRNITADTGAMYAGTFHAICERILKEYSDFTGRHKNFRVLDNFGHAYMIMQNMKKFSGISGLNEAVNAKGKWAASCELRDHINALSEELADPEELMRDSNPSVCALGKAMKIHDDILREANSLSWSALLVETYRLLRDNPEILSDLQSRVKYIMADEYQDTNYIQEQLVLLIAGESRNICAAGDDDQSIYRFRGAEVRNILEFPGRFGKNECKIVRLMLNYRSRPGIIDFFSSWMNDTGDFFAWENFRHDKKLEAYRSEMDGNPSVMRLAGINDRNEWHEKILHLITSLKDSGKLSDYSQIAFLFRSVRSPGVKALSNYLEEHNINVYSPRSNMFFQRAEIQFAIGCMILMFSDYVKALDSGAFIYKGTEPPYVSYYKTCRRTAERYISRPQYEPLRKHLEMRRKHHAKLTAAGNMPYIGYTFSDLVYELFAFEPFKHALDTDISAPVKELRPARNLSRLVQVIRRYEHSCNINNLNAKYMSGQFQMMLNIFIRFMLDEGMDEYESGDDVIPPGHVAFMTIHQAKGMEFPVVFADSLWAYPQDDFGSDIMQYISRKYYRRPEFEPSDRIKYFDFWRLYYTAFSRAQDLLILTCCEDDRTPSRYFERHYNRLNDADETLKPSEAEISPMKGSGLKNAYSFTGDILTYETCPTQYKFFRELEFMPGRSASMFTGTLIHAVLEDIHRAVINHEENRITPENISEWFKDEYEHLSRTEQAYLTQAARNTALSQIMRYVQRQGDDWSAVRRAEYEVNAVRGDYILEGKIDLLSVRDGETEITDFKSGPKPNININADRERLVTYRRQIFAYAYMAGNTTGLKADRLKLYCTGEESGSPEITYPYNSDEAEEIMKGFDETVSKIISRDFNSKAPDPETCRECVFKYYCGRV